MDLFVCAGALLVVISTLRAARAIADLRLWRRLRRQPAMPVSELEPGPVVVRGRVRALSTLKVPHSDVECVAYEVSEPTRLGTSRKAVPFLIEDASGAVEVRPDRMRVAAPVDCVLRVDSIGMKTLPGLARPVRVLREGDQVSVVGTARREVEADGGMGNYRDAPTKIVLRPGRGLGLAAVRDAGVLVRYAGPTLLWTGALFASGIGIIAATFKLFFCK
jgi:hypothetical protein